MGEVNLWMWAREWAAAAPFRAAGSLTHIIRGKGARVRLDGAQRAIWPMHMHDPQQLISAPMGFQLVLADSGVQIFRYKGRLREQIPDGVLRLRRVWSHLLQSWTPWHRFNLCLVSMGAWLRQFCHAATQSPCLASMVCSACSAALLFRSRPVSLHFVRVYQFVQLLRACAA